MAGIQLDDDEQSERLKAWWKENGVSIIVGAVLGIAVIGGVNYWRSYQAEQAAAASALYARLLEGGGTESAEAGRELLESYGGTAYGGKAALVMAKRAFADDDIEAATGHLEWAIDNAAADADRGLARLRLARIALSTGEYERARTLLSEMEVGGYASGYHELLGDLAMAQDNPDTARTEYQAALDNLPEQSGFAEMLNMKLDAAAGASSGASQ